MTYDLRRLRLHGLIERIEHTHRYRLTPAGLKVALFYSRTYQHVIRPGLSLLHQPQNLEASGLGRSYHQFEKPNLTFLQEKRPRKILTQYLTIKNSRILDNLRECWLNPPEWTVTRVLEFPGSAIGLWSRYVVNPDKNGIGTVRYPCLEARDADCAAKLKQRTMTNLYNERPTWLDLAHKKLDATVAAAYGWAVDLTDVEILERLLELNLQRAAAEARAVHQRLRTSRPKRDDELL